MAPLLLVWSRREFAVRYRQSALGFVWAVLQPLALVAIYGVVLRGLLDIGSEGVPYLSFAYAGMAAWAFVASSVTSGFPSIVGATPIIGKAYFPREVIPLSIVCATSADLGIATAMLVGIALIQGVGVSITLAGIVPVALVLAGYIAALNIFGAALTAFARDLRHAVPVLLQLLFFGTPIVYSSTLFPERWDWIARVNPLAVVVDSNRAAVLHHDWPDWPLLAVHAAVACVLFVASVAYIRSVEPRIVDLA